MANNEPKKHSVIATRPSDNPAERECRLTGHVKYVAICKRPLPAAGKSKRTASGPETIYRVLFIPAKRNIYSASTKHIFQFI